MGLGEGERVVNGIARDAAGRILFAVEAPGGGALAEGQQVVNGVAQDEDGRIVIAVDDGSFGEFGPSGRELDYAETQAAASTSQTLFANIADDTGDVAGLSIDVEVGLRPIMLEFWAQRVHNNTATAATIIAILEGNAIVALGRYDQHATASEGVPFQIRRRLAPAQGLHSYKVAMAVIGASTATIVASADGPAFLRATEA